MSYNWLQSYYVSFSGQLWCRLRLWSRSLCLEAVNFVVLYHNRRKFRLIYQIDGYTLDVAIINIQKRGYRLSAVWTDKIFD